jgi:hypothetical protein
MARLTTHPGIRALLGLPQSGDLLTEWLAYGRLKGGAQWYVVVDTPAKDLPSPQTPANWDAWVDRWAGGNQALKDARQTAPLAVWKELLQDLQQSRRADLVPVNGQILEYKSWLTSLRNEWRVAQAKLAELKDLVASFRGKQFMKYSDLTFPVWYAQEQALVRDLARAADLSQPSFPEFTVGLAETDVLPGYVVGDPKPPEDDNEFKALDKALYSAARVDWALSIYRKPLPLDRLRPALEDADMTPGWQVSMNRWRNIPLTCTECGSQYIELENVGRWLCHQHTGKQLARDKWSCCDSEISCTPADHRTTVSRYHEAHDILLPDNAPPYLKTVRGYADGRIRRWKDRPENTGV